MTTIWVFTAIWCSVILSSDPRNHGQIYVIKCSIVLEVIILSQSIILCHLHAKMKL